MDPEPDCEVSGAGSDADEEGVGGGGGAWGECGGKFFLKVFGDLECDCLGPPPAFPPPPLGGLIPPVLCGPPREVLEE